MFLPAIGAIIGIIKLSHGAQVDCLVAVNTYATTSTHLKQTLPNMCKSLLVLVSTNYVRLISRTCASPFVGLSWNSTTLFNYFDATQTII